ncbi:DMT family transporter [Streptacidiphilus sp. N1-12]|uniref:DMT family transporter n=2 Tax=Streptacidiphilus alkalitolerans TaxID=3342712 RepID=A0ABV6V738_9ACTN
MRTHAPATAATRRRTGLTLALLSACAFGGSGTAAKPLIEAGLTAMQVVWLRIALSALVLLPVAIRHRDLPRRHPGLLIGFGLVGVACVQGCYFYAISRIPVGVALLIEYLGPALLLGYVRFVQHRRVTRAAAVGAVVTMAGLALVVQFWNGLGGLDPIGVASALAAACGMVGYFILSEKSGPSATGGEEPARPIDPMGMTAYGLIIGAIVLLPIARPWETHWHLLGTDVSMGGTPVPALLLLGWVVLIATVLAYLTGVASVSRLSAPVAGVVACLEAVVATVLAWVLLGEHLVLPQIIGGLLVLAGACVAQTSTPSDTAAVDFVAPVGEAPHGEAAPLDAAHSEATHGGATADAAPVSAAVSALPPARQPTVPTPPASH